MNLSQQMMTSLDEIYAEVLAIRRKLDEPRDRPRDSCRESTLDAAECLKTFGLPMTALGQVRFLHCFLIPCPSGTLTSKNFENVCGKYVIELSIHEGSAHLCNYAILCDY